MSFAGLGASVEGCHDADYSHEAAACEVTKLGWRHGGFATRSAIVVEQSGVARVVEVMPCTQAVWSILSIAADGAVDQPRIYPFELFIPKAQTIHDPWPEAFEHHIGLAHQAQENFMPCLRLMATKYRLIPPASCGGIKRP